MVDPLPLPQPFELDQVLRAMSVGELPAAASPRVSPGCPLRTAAARMRAAGHGCVLVTRDRQLDGIFTERDWLRLLATGHDVELPVCSAMTRNPVWVSRRCSLLSAIQLMDSEHCRHLPVLDETGRPIGLLDVQQVLHFIAELYPHTIYSQTASRQLEVRRREGA